MSGPGKKPTIAPLPAPVPTPEDIDLEAQRKGESLRRQIAARKGRRGTVLTEGTLGDSILRPAQTSTILGQVGA